MKSHLRSMLGMVAPRLALIASLTAGLGPASASPAGAQPPPVDLTAVTARPGSPHLPAHWQHGAFMEIFVRAYQDSDGDGIGDLRGLISRLDYLQDLGVRGLWLMPVNPSADRDHGYATTDYRAIEPAYGTLDDFDELLRQAHRRGIGVIVDYVINHSAAQHPLFLEALKGPDNRYRDWFVWSDEAPKGWDIWGKNPWYHAASAPWNHVGDLAQMLAPAVDARGFYFGTFGPWMPDFNLRRPEVLDYHLDSLRFWLNRGLDGFRLDATPHLIENSATAWNDQPESRRLGKQLQDLILSYPNRYVVCEATAEPQAWGDPAVCGGAFAFGYVQHFVGAALGKIESVQALADYYRRSSHRMATFVSNHDIFAGRRLWDQVSGDEVAYKLAAAAYLLQPGTPYVYYGEEIGQAGLPALGGDKELRAPMSWTADPVHAGFTAGTPFRPAAPNVATHNVASQRADPWAIHAFYKSMLALRNARPSIARGSFEASFSQGLILGFQRRLGKERSLVLINYAGESVRVAVPGLDARATLRPLYPTTVPRHRAARSGALTLQLAPRSVQVFSIDR